MLSQYPVYKEQIEFVGDSSSDYSGSKLITVCCYNSIEKLTTPFEEFEHIFIDEAHHIRVPEIYFDDYDDADTSSSETESQTYLDIISNLSIHYNNVLLSATIDPIDSYVFYSKDINHHSIVVFNKFRNIVCAFMYSIVLMLLILLLPRTRSLSQSKIKFLR